MNDKIIVLIAIVVWFIVMSIEDWNPHEPPKNENDGFPPV